jgi:hypothetical protein
MTEKKILIGSEVEKILEKGLWTDHAQTMQKEVAHALEKAGFVCSLEVATRFLGDCRNGRIDIVAQKNGESVAIELDCRSPRMRSIKKLKLWDGYKILGLRGVRHPIIDGIDGVVCLQVKAP